MRDRPISRRGFLVLFAGVAAAACAPSAPPAPAKPTAPAAPASSPAAAAAPTTPPGAAAPAQAAGGGKPFTIVDGTEPNSLDPPVGTGPFGHPIRAIFESLVTFNTRMEPVPQLATSWDSTPDLKTWTFKLRPGVRFHDGTPFNSEAVKFSIMRISDPEVLSNRRANYALIQEIQTPDPQTAVFVLNSPSPDVPALLGDRSAAMVSPAAVQKAGNKEFGRQPVGTGQFVFKEWTPKTRIMLAPNPDYWGPKSKVSGFIYRPIPEGAARVAALRTGEADIVMKLPPEDLDALKGDQNLIIAVQPSLTQVCCHWRVGKPPFGDVRVRKAASLAIDRDAIVKNVLAGVAAVPRGPAPPALAGAATLDPIPYDVEAAKRLMAEAGFSGGFSGEFSYVSGRWPRDDQVAEVLVSYLGKVGIKLNIRKIEQAELDNLLTQDPDTGNSDIVMPIRTSQYLDYHLYRLYDSVATKAQAAQRTGYGNPEVDRLLEEARKTADPATRNPLYQQAEKLIWDDYALLWVIDLSSVVGSRKGVTGWEYLPLDEIVVTNVEKA